MSNSTSNAYEIARQWLKEKYPEEYRRYYRYYKSQEYPGNTACMRAKTDLVLKHRKEYNDSIPKAKILLAHNILRLISPN